MTRLTKAIRREAHIPGWGEVVLRFAPEGCYWREQGRRTWYGPVCWGSVARQGVEMAAEARRAARQGRGAGRGRRR